jgi:hypothetical protein
MKRLFIVLSLICCIALTGFAASAEDLEIYTYLYENSRTIPDQLGILTVLQTLKLNGAGEFYAKALNRLVIQYPTILSGPTVEKLAADDLAQALAALVGEEKYTAAAPDLWRTVGAFSSPLVKAEALIALGKLRATAFLPQVIRVLQDLNAAPPSGREEADAKGRIAMGAIISLEKYRDPSGYLPVFFMSASGYPDRVKVQAAKSLPIILDDPSAPLTEVIRGASYPYSTKFLALQTAEAANISNESKAGVALVAFSEGWRSSTNDVRQRQELARMRKTSINMLLRYGIDDPAVYPLLERSYKEGGDDDEKLGSIATLASLASEDSARLLSSFLLIINGRMQSGSSNRTDETMIRAIIPALGNIGKASGRSALRSVLSSDWPNMVKNLANDALSKLPAS